jgi:hypothetical protein
MSLLTVAEYRIATNTDESDDDMLDFACTAASQAILNYTDRDFGSAAVTEDRDYLYDGKGFLEIDDCTAVNSVVVASTTLAANTYYAMPYTGTIKTWLELPPQRLVSGEMGFTYNLDVYLQQRGFQTLEVTVNADWGYTPVPEDVKMAVVWTAAYMLQNPAAAGGLTAESVAEVARSYALQQTAQREESIPERARLVLDAYRRPVI